MSAQGATPAPFAYDFASLLDTVEWGAQRATPNERWRILIRLDSETQTHFLRAVKGRGDACEVEPVRDADFDAAALRLAPRLTRRGALPPLLVA